MQYLREKLDVRIVDTIFNPDEYGANDEPKYKGNELKVSYIKSDDKTWLYKVWLFLAGEELPLVESVTYHLHETFPDPIRTVRRDLSNLDCRLVIWTWGTFQVNANILDKYGRTYTISHNLNYGELIRKYQEKHKDDSEFKLVYIEENPNSGANLVVL